MKALTIQEAEDLRALYSHHVQVTDGRVRAGDIDEGALKVWQRSNELVTRLIRESGLAIDEEGNVVPMRRAG